LAEFAGISVPYLADIERCRTWVSDKTLQNLAHALNMEPWELLCGTPENSNSKSRRQSGEKENRKQIAETVSNKKEILRKTVENVMEDLILELVQKKQK